MTKRATYAETSNLIYRVRAAGALLGVTDNTMRGYADNAGIHVKRASDTNPNAPGIRVFDPATLFEIGQWRRNHSYIKTPPRDGRPIVVAVDVIKGGTGKTTTSVELAIHMQLFGMRVMLIDLDVQANATQLMGYEPDLTMDEAESYNLTSEAIVTDTFASLLIPYLDRARGSPNLRQQGAGGFMVKTPFGDHGPKLVPADTFLGDIEQALANAKGQRELYIRQFLAAANKGQIAGFDISDIDLIIFDCPPNVSFTSTAALAAADYVVAPVRLDAFSIKGLTRLMTEINSLDEGYQVRPELVILPTHYAPQLVRMGRMQAQINKYKHCIADSTISASEEFPKSLDNYLPLSLQKPLCNSAREYKGFAQEMLDKMVSKANKRAKE
jgi:chromosome partitioning protein